MAVARALRGAARRTDAVARMGGDEFVVLLDGCAPEGAQRIAEDLRGACAHLHPAVSLSVGVACGTPGDVAGIERLAVDSDRALYAAKGAGRDRVVWAEPRRGR